MRAKLEMPTDTSPSNEQSIQELLDQFLEGSERKRRSLLSSLETRAKELSTVVDHAMSSFDPEGSDWAAGSILQVVNLYKPEVLNDICSNKSNYWLQMPSEREIDYSLLQKELLQQNFEEADRFTSKKLRELAGPDAEQRGYVYFSEVENMPGVDLVTLDRLWIVFSQGKFGFSVQAKLLETVDNRYEKLWPRIGWKKDGIWTRYPNAFTWSIEAPVGHMPLVNQLRGVRLMDAILNHPALASRR